MEIFSNNAPSISMKNQSRIPRIDMAGVGKRLEALRDAHQLSRKEFSDSFGLDASSYTKTANGDKQLRSEAAFAIAEQWGVPMDYLFRGSLTGIDPDLRNRILNALNHADE